MLLTPYDRRDVLVGIGLVTVLAILVAVLLASGLVALFVAITGVYSV